MRNVGIIGGSGVYIEDSRSRLEDVYESYLADYPDAPSLDEMDSKELQQLVEYMENSEK